MAIRKEMHNKRPRLNLLPPVYVEVLCLVASLGLGDSQVDLDLAENVDVLLYFKILHRNKETAWTDKYMDVISKDEPFRCESFSFLNN